MSGRVDDICTNIKRKNAGHSELSLPLIELLTPPADGREFPKKTVMDRSELRW